MNGKLTQNYTSPLKSYMKKRKKKIEHFKMSVYSDVFRYFLVFKSYSKQI